MINAVLRNGVIYPLDPIPEGWRDGQQVFVEDAQSQSTSNDIDAWNARLEAIAAQFHPGDFERMESILIESDLQAKAHVRRQMGLE